MYKSYRVPFHRVDLGLSVADMKEIESMLRNGNVVSGVWTDVLEKHFVENSRAKYAIACSSCTQGLIHTLDAAKFKRGTVAIPNFTWTSTYEASRRNFNTTIFCDIDRDSWLIKPVSAVDLIIAVDTFGNQANVYSDIPVVYDAAHGYGLDDLGGRGLAEVVSLAMTKTVTGMQGGVVLTNDEKLYNKLRERVALSSKITEVGAYIAYTSALKYSQNQKNRLHIIGEYLSRLDVEYELQKINECSNHSVFAILLESEEKRNRVEWAFHDNSIEPKVYYEPMIDSELHVNTNEVYSRIIALPVWNGVERYIPEICEIINAA